jgi:hypothetical protein
MNLVVSYLLSFPLMMGEGKDGGGRLGPYPPHLNPPPPWGEEFIFGSIGIIEIYSVSEEKSKPLF